MSILIHRFHHMAILFIPVSLHTTLQTGRSRVRFPMVSLEFFSDLSFRSHYGPGIDSASNRNDYQVYFLG